MPEGAGSVTPAAHAVVVTGEPGGLTNRLAEDLEGLSGPIWAI